MLDEPDQHLDTAGREWLARALRAEKDRGTAVLLASHHPEFVSAVADGRVNVVDGD